MKIIYVTARLPHGRDEAFVVPEINQLRRSGHEVLIVPRSPRGPVLHGRELLNHSRLEMLLSREVLKSACRRAFTAPRQTAAIVWPVFESRSPGIAIRNLAVVPKALWLAEIASAWGAHHIHCHWAATTATMAMLASHISGIPWSFTAHRWDIVEDNLLSAKARSASFARFISEDGLRMAQSIGIGSAAKARVLHMGVAIPAQVHHDARLKPVVLCPARLVAVKGHRFLLEAWRMLQCRGVNGEMWLAGDGELRPEIQALSRTLGLAGSIKFLGALEHSELLRIYESGAVSAAVLASLDLGNGNHEGIPVALIEAMSYAIPVVATATGGTPELIIPGTGLLLPPADAGALADAIQILFQNQDLSRQIGFAARKHVERNYDIVRIAAALLSEFDSAAGIRSLTVAAR